MTTDTVPVCENLMEGVEASSRGTTVANLDLQQGYYRTSATSKVVLECYFEDACVGGSIDEEYCAEGYKGPCKFDVPTEFS